MSDYATLAAEIRDAAQKFEIDRLQVVVDGLISRLHEFEAEAAADARSLLGLLRGMRRYLELVKLAEAYIKSGFTDPRIHTLYAQAMIELGRHVPAIGILKAIAKEVEDSKDEVRRTELTEIYGILGRAWKDIGYEALLNCGGTEVSVLRKEKAKRALNEAYLNYQRLEKVKSGDLDGLSWYSVNLLGLCHLAQRFGILLDQSAPDGYAQEVIAALVNAGNGGRTPNEWNLACLCELSAAVGKFDDARHYADIYIGHKCIDGFKLASTERQLNLIWNIRTSEDGRALHNQFLNALLTHQGGFSLDARQLRTSRGPLQLQHGDKGVVNLAELRNAFRIAQSVAMIRKNFGAIGTGFVVKAAQLGLDPALDRVVLTNAHVVSDPPRGNAVGPQDAQLTFHALPDAPSFNVERVIRTLDVGQHDCSVLVLAEPLPAEARALTLGDLNLKPDSTERAYVIGHPAGQELAFSLFDSELLGYDKYSEGEPQRVHYRSPTFYGSSGSPVFNKNWRVIALHRAGYESVSRLDGQPGTYAANEGISIASIRAALKGGYG